MTGPSPEDTGSDQAAAGSENLGAQPAGRRAWLRRLWRPGAHAALPASPAVPLGATSAAAVGAAAAGGVGAVTAGGPGESDAHAHVPRLLQTTGAWSWRLLLTGLVIYLAFRLAVFLRLVTLPFIAAMLATALLQPFVAWLRRRGFPPLLSTWCSFLLALVLIAGAITLLAS